MLAKVNESQLFYHQLPAHLRNYSGKDSAALVSAYINNWIQDELLVQAADQVINEEDPEIADKLKKYRNYLLVSEFKRRYLASHVDTVVTEEDLQKYYNRYSSEFILESDLLRGTFVKLPVKTPGIKDFAKKLGKPDKEVRSYCARYSSSFNIDSWISAEDFVSEGIFSEEQMTSVSSLPYLLEKSDEDFTYVFYISQRKRRGEKTPFEFAKHDIEAIILNDRRNKVITKLEEEVYNDGRKTKSFEIF
jgi:hypothetical protein